MDEFADRVLAAVIDIGHLHRNQKALVISHGWALDVVNRQVAGVPRHAVLAEKPKNGECVSVRVDVDGNGITQSSSSAVPRSNIGSAVMGR